MIAMSNVKVEPLCIHTKYSQGGFHRMTKCNIEGVTNGQGLIPGIIEDVTEVLSMGDAVSEKDGSFGSNKCSLRKGRVGKNINDGAMQCTYSSILNTPSYDRLYECLYKENPPKSWWVEKRYAPNEGLCGII